MKYASLNIEILKFASMDDKLSLKAKGLLLYLAGDEKILGVENVFGINNEDISKKNSDGKSSVDGAIRELLSKKYVHRVGLIFNGKIKKCFYVFSIPDVELTENDIFLKFANFLAMENYSIKIMK